MFAHPLDSLPAAVPGGGADDPLDDDPLDAATGALTAEQRAAVEHRDGHLLIVAGSYGMHGAAALMQAPPSAAAWGW